MRAATMLLFSALIGCSISSARAQSCQEWRLRATSGPSPRGEFGLAYDSKRSMTVLVGGAQNLGFDDVFRETWEWDGRAWALVSTKGPSRRCDNAMNYDSSRGVVVSFGGYDGVFLRDTWVWNGVFWEEKTAPTGPAARADAPMAFDPTDGTMTMFGGYNGVARQDTWRWNGTTWTQLAPATSPDPRWIHRMTYDAARDEIVFFGGAGNTTVLNDHWAWTGSNWVQRTPVAVPPARYGNAIAYDTHQQVVRIFGGQAGFFFGQNVLGDMWEWNSTAWSPLAVGDGPSARTFTKMVYDQRRRKLVLFGGHDGTTFLNDTWEFGSDLDVATDPTSLAVEPGEPAQFHVVASGTGPFTYQWLKDGAPLADGANISGATTDTLVLSSAQPGDAGKYSAAVSNACGPVNSRDALLVVPPVAGAPGQMHASYDRLTGRINVTYTPACAADDHTVHWGLLAAVKNYAYVGVACGLGTTGSASFLPGAGSYFFMIVGDDGILEGSYGLDGRGAERPPSGIAAPCALPQSLNALCD